MLRGVLPKSTSTAPFSLNLLHPHLYHVVCTPSFPPPLLPHLRPPCSAWLLPMYAFLFILLWLVIIPFIEVFWIVAHTLHFRVIVCWEWLIFSFIDKACMKFDNYDSIVIYFFLHLELLYGLSTWKVFAKLLYFFLPLLCIFVPLKWWILTRTPCQLSRFLMDPVKKFLIPTNDGGPMAVSGNDRGSKLVPGHHQRNHAITD